MKNKKLLWILAMVILVVGSIAVTALTNPFSGISGRIGRLTGDTSMVYLLVNTLLIGLFIFIVVHLLPDDFGGKFFKPKSNTANAVFFIALIGISIAFAIRIGGMFIWNEEAVVRPAFRYLFTQDAEGRIGILRPTRILIFMGASFLLYWLFISTIKIGQGKNSKIDLAIAIILAADMTHQGLTSDWLITFGQIISIWLLYRQFKREGEKGWSWSAGIWSAGLVIWLSAIAFPGRGFFLVRGMGAFFKKIGIFSSLLLIIIGAVVLTAVGVFTIKKEKEARAKHGTLKNIGQNLLQKIVNFIHGHKILILSQLFREAKVRSVLIGDPDKLEIGKTIKKMWFELFTQMNYLLRLEVYDSKGSYAESRVPRLTQIFEGKAEEGDKPVHVHTVTGINANIDRYKIGTGFDPSYDSKTGLWKTDILGEDEETGTTTKLGIREDFYFITNDGKLKKMRYRTEKGAFSAHFIMMAFFMGLKEAVEELSETDKGGKDKSSPDVAAQSREVNATIAFDGHIDKYTSTERSQINQNYSSFQNYFGRRGNINLVRSTALTLLGQYKLFGEYRHSYKFARTGDPDIPPNKIGRGTRVYNVGYIAKLSEKEPPFYEWKAKNEFKEPVYERDINGNINDPDNAMYIGEVKGPLEENEVTPDGYFIDDINEIKMTGKTTSGGLRRVKIKERLEIKDDQGNKREILIDNIIDYPTFTKAANWLAEEWKYFQWDVRDGRFHPNSRKVTQYEFKHDQEGVYDYKNLQNDGLEPGRGAPAFDREALLDIGRFVYWGKKKMLWNDAALKNDAVNNPFPTLTTIGLTRYISNFINRFAKEEEKKQMEYFVWESEGEEGLFTGHPQEKKT